MIQIEYSINNSRYKYNLLYKFRSVKSMLIGREKFPEIPIESYSKQLIFYLHKYLNMVDFHNNYNSPRANEEAKIYLRWFIYPNNKELERDYNYIKDDMGSETWNAIYKYTRCIMSLLGKVAECVIIDHCINNRNTNIICMNMAKFKPNIYEEYSDIKYDDYLVFSPSYKYVFAYDDDGYLVQYPIPDYNPHHTSKDIAWCKRDNIISQLKTEIPEASYLENAKLQIKTTLDGKNLYFSSNSYITTPIVCFDLSYDCEILKKRYPKHIIFSAKEINQGMFDEVSMYFKILTAYATGMINKIDISEKDVVNNLELMKLFRTPVKYIMYMTGKKREILDTSGVIGMINKYKKPIVVEG